jgi:error-prone DNA polymerase
MGWDNPPMPWRELERRLSWGTLADAEPGQPPPRPVTRLPAPAAAGGSRDPRGPGGQAPPWAELHCHSSYSFLDGASSPAELVAEAARLGLEALAVTDHNGMYGVPQFAQAAAKLAGQTGITLGTVFGAELSLSAGPGGGPPRDPPGGRGPGP